MRKQFAEIFTRDKAIIGMIHLPPLPGYAGSPGMETIVRQAVADVHTLAASGFDGALVENEYDRPHSVTASATTVEAMTIATRAVVEAAPSLVVGCEILLNDPYASLDVALASGARFIRTDYFVDQMTRPGYGEFEADADAIISHRHAIGADDVLLLADIQVKYAQMIRPRPLAESASLALQKGADAIVVTGTASGTAPLIDHLDEAVTAANGLGGVVLAGSGTDPGNIGSILARCDGAIVGTSLMRERRVCADRAAALMEAAGVATQ